MATRGTITLPAPTGGLNTTDPPDRIATNELTVATNVLITPLGAKVMPGTDQVSDNVIGTGSGEKAQAIAVYDGASDDFLVSVSAGGIYTYDYDSGVSGSFVERMQTNDRAIYGNWKGLDEVFAPHLSNWNIGAYWLQSRMFNDRLYMVSPTQRPYYIGATGDAAPAGKLPYEPCGSGTICSPPSLNTASAGEIELGDYPTLDPGHGYVIPAFTEWSGASVAYSLGQCVHHDDGKYYNCISGHTSTATHPHAATTLWAETTLLPVVITGDSVGSLMEVEPVMELDTVVITNAGSGYTPGTFTGVAITGGTTPGACTVVVSAAGEVTSVTITNRGAEFTTIPTIGTVAGGSGFAYTVTCRVSAVRVTAAGSGYVAGPPSLYVTNRVAYGSSGVYISASTTGPLNGVYDYAITYLIRDTETNTILYESQPCDPIYTRKLSGTGVKIYNLGYDHVQMSGAYAGQKDAMLLPAITHIAIYRRGGSSGDYRLVTELPVSSLGPGASYPDFATDSQLGRLAPQNNYTPPKSKWIEVINGNRLVYVTEAGDIYVSSLDGPEYVTDDPAPVKRSDGCRLRVPGSGATEITAVVTVQDYLVVLTRNSMYALRFNDSSDFIFKKIGETGCIGTGSAKALKGGCIWLSRQGFKYWSPSEGLLDISAKIDKTIQTALEGGGLGATVFCTAVVTNTHYFCNIVPASNLSSANLSFAMSLETGGWSRAGGRWTGMEKAPVGVKYADTPAEFFLCGTPYTVIAPNEDHRIRMWPSEYTGEVETWPYRTSSTSIITRGGMACGIASHDKVITRVGADIRSVAGASTTALTVKIDSTTSYTGTPDATDTALAIRCNSGGKYPQITMQLAPEFVGTWCFGAIDFDYQVRGLHR